MENIGELLELIKTNNDVYKCHDYCSTNAQLVSVLLGHCYANKQSIMVSLINLFIEENKIKTNKWYVLLGIYLVDIDYYNKNLMID